VTALDTQYAECCYVECLILYIVVENVIMQSAVMQSAILMSVFRLNVIMLSAVATTTHPRAALVIQFCGHKSLRFKKNHKVIVSVKLN
jgi:hypothetical protein